MSTADDTTPSNEVERVFAEFLHRREAGSSAGIEQLCQQHPELSGELHKLWGYWTEVAGVLNVLGETSDTGSLLKLLYGVEGAADLELGDGDSAAPGSDAATESLYERLEMHRPSRSRYQVRECIGSGGMGSVHRVWDEDLHRHVAMKTILDRKKTPAEFRLVLARFLEEAQITGQLDHPGVVPVHELGVDSTGRVFFTMALVRGHHLGEVFDLLREGKEAWTLTRVLGVMIRVCEALAYAHSKKVVHRDLKPANVMVGRFGQTYVMDWGLARVLGRRDLHDLRFEPSTATTFLRTERDEAQSPVLTRDGHRLGTLFYMSPEQAAGKVDQVDERSDIYSLGAILYHLLTGHPPYSSEGDRTPPTVVQARVLQGPPEPVAGERPDAPADLVAICERAMQRKPAARYSGVLEMARDLEAYLGTRPVSAAQPSLARVLRLAYRRNRALSLTGLAAVLLLVTALVAFAVSVQQSLRKTDAELALLRQVASTQGDLAASIAAVDRYLAVRPADVDMLLKAVQLRVLEGSYDPAADLAETIAREHPQAQGQAWALLGVALLSTDPARAQQCRERARHELEAQGASGQSLYRALAEDTSQEGSLRAIDVCHGILEREPADVWARWELACRYQYLTDSRYDDPLLEEASYLERLSPRNPSFRLLKGNALFRKSRFVEALDYFQDSSLGDPPPPLAAYNRGLAHWRLGEREQAAADFESFLEREHRKDDEARMFQARALFHVAMERNKWGELSPRIHGILDDLSTHPALAPEALQLKVRVLEWEGDTQAAAPAFEALMADAGYPQAAFLAASRDYRQGAYDLTQGQLDKATADFQSALDRFEKCFLGSPPDVPVPEDFWGDYRGAVGALGWSSLLNAELSGEVEAAAEQFWHRAALTAMDPEGMLNLGLSYWIRGDLRPAATALSLACRFNPELEMPKLWIWYLLDAEDREKEAAVWLDSADRDATRHGDALLAGLVEVFRSSAVTGSLCEQVLQDAGSSRKEIETCFCLGLRYTSLGDDDQASEFFERCGTNTGEYESLLAHYFLTR